MTRRKKLAIVGIVVALALTAGFVAVSTLRGPSMLATMERIRIGMDWYEVLAILGEPDHSWQGQGYWWGKWSGREGVIDVSFTESRVDRKQRVFATRFSEAPSSGFLDRVLSWFGL